MSTPNQSTWTTPILFLAVGALAFYSMASGPGNCPLNPASSRQAPATQAPIETTASPEARLVHADNSTFDRVVLQADEPVLVDFYADWCGPCQRLAPLLDRVAEDLTHGRIVKVDVDRSPELAARFEVRSIPTLLVFEDGQVTTRTSGIQTEEELKALLEQDG